VLASGEGVPASDRDCPLDAGAGKTRLLAEVGKAWTAAGLAPLAAAGTDALLMAADHSLRRELSRRIRDDLVRLGIVGPGRDRARVRPGRTCVKTWRRVPVLDALPVTTVIAWAPQSRSRSLAGLHPRSDRKVTSSRESSRREWTPSFV